jgi:2,7-dihydroxy-5-methyl-1-naphthoate 7-O-methyltransferase
MPNESLRMKLYALGDLVTPMALRVAATLRLADHIDGGANTIPELAERTGSEPDALGRIVRHLVPIDVITDGGDGTYGLGPLGRLLLSDDSARGRDWLDIAGAVGRADLALFRLLETVTTGRAGYPLVYGRTFWEDLADDPVLSASFDALMGAHVHTDLTELVHAFDWTSATHVVDVGGGNGTLLSAILAEHPGLHGTLVDLPGPAAAAKDTMAAQGLADRCDVVVGSFFDPLPVGGDVYLLSGVIHDWDDDDARSILRRCSAAAGHGGTVVVIEGHLDEHSSSPRTGMDIRMLAYMSGRERTLAQLDALAATADLAITDYRSAAYRTLIELKPSR